MDYVVVTKATDEGVSAWVPGLPGCWSEGATEAEALDNIKDAISEYVAAADELARKDSNSRAHIVHINVA